MYRKTLSGLLILSLVVTWFPFDVAFATEPVDYSLDRETYQSGLRLQAQPNLYDGSFSYELPLTLPPGRDEMWFDLKLVYSSNDRSNLSPYGYGWSDNIPYVERINRKGANKLYTEDLFRSTFDGELKATSTSAGHIGYGALVEQGDFRQYVFVDESYWEVVDKEGTVFTFGSATTSQVVNTASTTQVARWMLEKIEDTNGNSVEFTYYKDSNALYPYKINYTEHASTPGIYEVEFLRESRTDIATSSAWAFPVVSNYRIDEIQVKVNGSWERKYELAYTTGDNEYRSMLSSVTESGKDILGATTTLPATTFTYSASTPDWTIDESWYLPTSFIDNRDDYGSRAADFNGDGRVDILRSEIDGTVRILYENELNGAWSTTTPSTPFPYAVDFYHNDRGDRTIDINGDGFSDILPSGNYAYLNTTEGESFPQETSDWDNPMYFSEITCCRTGTSDDYSQDEGGRIFDLNGDGLPDLAQGYRDSPLSTYEGISDVYLNNGTGWDATTTNGWLLPDELFFAWHLPSVTPHKVDYGARVADLNGDGLLDVFLAHEKATSGDVETRYDIRILFNDGDGTWTEVEPDVPETYIHFADYYGSDQDYRIVDVNGDGLPDILDGVQNGDIWINRGDGTTFTADVNWSGSPVDFSCTNSSNCGFGDVGSRLFDIDADGIVDIIRGETEYEEGYDPPTGVYLGNGVVPDLLKTVTTNTGATITATYTTSAQQTNPDLPLNLTVLDTLVEDDGFGNIGTTTYSYGGGEYYYQDAFDRLFAGFATTTEIDAYGNVTKKFWHQGNGSQTGIGENSDDRSKIGFAYRIEEYDDSNNLYRVIIDKWENVDLSNGRDYVKRTRSLELDYDGDGDHRDKATEWAYNDENGNLIEKIEYGEVSGSTDGTFTDSGSDKRAISYAYATSTSPWIIGLPKTETAKNNAGTKVAEKKFYYDNQSHGSVTKGNKTKEEQWERDSNYIDWEWSYDTYGNITQEKDPLNNATAFVYESSNLFVGTSTNAESHVEEFYRDYSSGKVTKHVDPNGFVTETVYDGLDRPVTEKIPDHLGTPSNLVTKTTYAYTDTVGSRKILQTDYLNSATSTTNYTYLDGFDRTIQERVEAEDPNTYNVKDTQYDALGNVSKQSLPYQSTGSARTSITGDSDLLITYTYDPLNRIKTIVNTKGTETHTYDQWKETITDRNSNTRDLYSDAFGNLVQVDEHEDVNTYSTYYIYDALDNLTKITDALSNVRNFTYDGLSQLTLSEDLHDTADTTFASTTYAYDVAGNVTSKQDGELQIITYTYDSLNRVLSENYTGEAGTEIEYGYDWCSDGIGQLCSATTTDAISTYAYDALGNIAIENKTIDGTTYVTSYTYDRLGNQTSITYPDNSIVAYEYDDAGLLRIVKRKPTGESEYRTAVAELNYSPTGAVAYKLFGNGIESTYTYDSDELYRLKNILTAASTTWESQETTGGALGLLDWPIYALKKIKAILVATPQLLAQAIVGEEPLEIEIASTTETVEEITEENAETDPAESTALGDSAATPTSGEIVVSEEEIPTTTKEVTEEIEVTSTSTAEGADVVTDTATTSEEIKSETAVQDEVTEAQELPKQVEIGSYLDKGDRYALGKSHSNGNGVEVEVIKTNPEVRLKKWNGEVNVGVSYEDVSAEGIYTTDDRVEWKDEKEEVHAYPLDAKEGLEGGGFEIEVYLKEKPQKNTFTFSIDGAENLDFFYQPPLSEEAIEGQTCTATECTDEEGNVKTRRPENIVGSYAVYRKNKSGNNYKTGKVFHIYRPQIIDANENKTWGTLTYENGSLAVEVPQNFLDKATYPVTVDPTFGYTSLGSSFQQIADWFSDDNERAGHAENLSEAGTLDSLHAGLRIDSTVGGNQTVSIYIALNTEDTSGDSHDEVASVENDKIITSTSAAWFTFTAASENLAADDYVINIVGDGSDINSTVSLDVAYDSSGSRNNYYEDFTGTYASAKENPWTETDSSGSRRYSLYATYTATSSNTAPSAPTSLETEGQTNPTDISDPTPEFSAVYNDDDSGDIADYYQIQVSTSSAFTSTDWDSTKTALASSTPEGTRIADISYSGSTLASSTTYYWRIKFWDDSDAEGNWSTATSTFSLAASGGGGGGGVGNVFQDISYIYDNVGNITSITDLSDTGAGKAITYTYDDLYRLLSASTTAASSTPYYRTYAYNALGNITNKSDQGTYTYNDDGYNNPHAADTINSVDLTYDNVGNVTDYGSWNYTWDYRNRLTQSSNSTATTTYGYDQDNQRVFKVADTATTTYPNKYYNTSSATTTLHIFLPNGDLVATVEQSTGGSEGGGSSSDTGYQNPSSTGETYTEWTSPTNAYSSNDSDASADPSRGEEEQDYYDFGFSVPSGATIDGIEVSIEGESDERLTSDPVGTYTSDVKVRLSWDSGSSWTSWDQKDDIFPNDTGTDTTEIWGTATSTWSRTWSDTEFSNANFRVHAYVVSGGYRGITFIDHVTAKVYYTTSGGGGGGSSATTTSYIHTDHLGGTNVVTNASSTVAQVLDYYPFGDERIDNQYGSTDEVRKFVGMERDDSTGLDYAKMRYYDNSRGQFTSQDPSFLAIGDPGRFQQVAGQDMRTVLADPQLQNSYSWGRNNPITNKDPNGNLAFAAPLYYGAITAPQWVPWVVGGIVAAGTYITADIALRNNDTWGTRWGGTVPTIDPGSMGFSRPPMGPEDWRPNLNGNQPEWMKTLAKIGIGATAVNELARPVYELYQSLTNRGSQAQQMLGPQLNSSSVQTRYQAVQNYNAATGATTPQQQLWTTPNGTVINWGGQITAPAPSNSSGNK